MAVLIPAIVLRVIAMLGFRWALWFNDSYQYLQYTVGPFRPDPTRPSGYSVYLRLLEPLHSFAIVTISQHLMGLGIGVMVYALLVHRFKVPLWIATLAAVPALYDAYQIQLEHLLMADTLFAFLVTAAITIVMWRQKPGMTQTAAAGLLLGLAAVTRSIGLPLLVIVVGVPAYQARRRARRRRRDHRLRGAGGRLHAVVPVLVSRVRDDPEHRDLPVCPRDGIRGLRQVQPAGGREGAVHVRTAEPSHGLAGLHLEPATPRSAASRRLSSRR